ncbi:SAVED domain-containing protein [Dyadobacter sp. 22481]|uniref:SAVED domain-containing protein n=1 Tax=Dyadobacter sp. 22481 TaxID=3453926 RepID=UPI003F845427
MSVTSISTNNKYLLWVLSAGRCQYRGCNKSLREDILTKKNFNQSYIAHVVADQPGGPRGHSTRSPQLADDITNLMLLCDTHHRLVDKIEVAAHPESILLEMKKEHEDRIKRNTDIAHDMQSHIVTYKANIGNSTPNLSYQVVSNYLLPSYYPAVSETIDLSTSNSLNRDSDPSYWSEEEANLERQFNRKLLQNFTKGEIKHLSIFAIAPMPLLVKLGTLINNIYPARIHQKIRVPDTWNLSDANEAIDYHFIEPNCIYPTVALNISLSANITNDRITDVLGTDCSIFTLTIDNPSTNFLQNKRQLADFGTKIQEVFNVIKSKYNSKTPLHVFPTMPVATAIEMGRVWMPKADMPLHLYDENTSKGGFLKAIQILNQ